MYSYGMFPGYGGYGMGWWWGLLLPLSLLDVVLRGFALWYSARAKQQWWFIALLVVNSMGILPAIYLFIHRDSIDILKSRKSRR